MISTMKVFLHQLAIEKKYTIILPYLYNNHSNSTCLQKFIYYP